MQTFLPYSSFEKSAEALDSKRLGKQRVEGMQILNAIQGKLTKKGLPYRGWTSHPITVMWRGYTDSLKEYVNCIIREWIKRGYKNTMSIYEIPDQKETPVWLGNESFHASHRASLLRKDFEYYTKKGWKEVPSPNVLWYKEDKWYTTRRQDKQLAT